MADKFLVIPNPTKQEAIDYVAKVADILGRYGKETYVPESYAQYISCEGVRNACAEDMYRMDMAIVLGGDGTVLRAINTMGYCDMPIFGINFGHIGYLTQCDPDMAEECLRRVVDGDFETEERITVKCTIHNGDEISEAVGINEIAIHRGAVGRALHMQICVNGDLVERLSGDGVIVATPTGSTAYNMSAGGPVVIPTANNVVITPVCAYSNSDCSIVASGDDVITICLESGEYLDRNSSATLCVDGIGVFDFSEGDMVTVSKSPYRLRLAKFTNDSFYQILKKKLKG